MGGAAARFSFDWLGLESWDYGSFFDPVRHSSLHSAIQGAEAAVADAKLDQHPFFTSAAASRAALELWVSQELVMTNAFSQIVLAAASRIQNVHARAIMTEIAYGEHGRAKAGFAKGAHPWLLERLRASVDLPRERVSPLEPTMRFISRLTASLADQLTAVAYIGVGNERLIDPEYTAIERCFRSLIPNGDFGPFLHANLNEDIRHSHLCYELASIMIRTEKDAKKYLKAARQSIASRVRYFDELQSTVQNEARES